LNSDPDTKLADSGPGSKDQETEYFGPLTKAAIIKFQEKYKK
jgi:peptidoglycan hydrolase-like protein with peptidoglycan-binding domain